MGMGRLLPDFPPVSEPNPESFRSISTEVVHLSLSLWITIVELPLELELKTQKSWVIQSYKKTHKKCRLTCFD